MGRVRGSAGRTGGAYETGYVYVLSNPSFMGNPLKIGFTERPYVESRLRELSTAVPEDFVVEFQARASNVKAVERAVHERLADARVRPGREYFDVTVEEAVKAVRAELLRMSGIGHWGGFADFVRVEAGDILALSARAGDVFLVQAHHRPDDPRPDLLDLWEVHATGDMLELEGTATPAPSFAAGDEEALTDPRRYFDPKEERPNGILNGHEGLFPADRLVWLSARSDGGCDFAMFEMRSHCRVLSRTWDVQLVDGTWPKILNYYTWDRLPPAMERAGRIAMRVGRPDIPSPRPIPDYPRGGFS
ncbi:hypothetical protein Afil01_64320 [Actinorhabdospora filicis]|uniref:Bacteriophage T5 Orf172 DNA-binding domain-containing protein n=1 Tax=Actinorhabdospora filicis TaxID=1785913 RepID=A0A9W6SRJ2_9ACTN|nr:GIY-YIG nuclease family protein [Actinorhabdospora filicis]GLZ81625.1 hypothetical protein Afil01_64320 [Actinorhabdospora filicis]